MDLLTIGQFARLTGLTVRAVRHYGELGLLQPAYVDPDTGYRYYSADQLTDAAAIRRLRFLEVALDEIREIVTRRLREVGLGGAEEKMPNELSGGMRKRAGFARALVLDPEIVLFDEPDSGLDPVRTALLCDLIREVHEENGGTYVVITHDIASARPVDDLPRTVIRRRAYWPSEFWRSPRRCGFHAGRPRR